MTPDQPCLTREGLRNLTERTHKRKQIEELQHLVRKGWVKPVGEEGIATRLDGSPVVYMWQLEGKVEMTEEGPRWKD